MAINVAQGGPRPSPLSTLGWAVAGVALAALLILAVGEMNMLAMLGLVTLPLLVLVVMNVEFGVYCLLVYSSVLAFLIRMMPAGNTGPIGLALDGLLLIMGARLLFDLAMRRDWKIFASPVTPAILAFVVYECIEVFNPSAPSIVFGFWGLRVTARILGFFLILYYFRERAAITRFVWLWLGLMMAIGAYGIFQHHHGLLWQEMQWLLTEGNASTHILKGYVRVFSTVGDAATFGFLMITGVLMAFAMASVSSGWRQALLVFSTLPMLYGMTASYSRGPVVALVAGAAAMIVASRNWKLGFALSGMGALGIALLIASGSTGLVDRLASAGDTQDASLNVRSTYIATYAPEIAKRPFGYGINTSGGSGLRAAGGAEVRNSVVGVPTDNYYFKVALEMGWVGLILWLWLNIVAVKHAYDVYRRTTDPLMKSVALGLFATFFALVVGAFSNDIIAQKPIAEYFWIAIGLLVLIGQRRDTPPVPMGYGQPLMLAAPRRPEP